jgi:ABC-type amino acid transport substrate-binding protein
VERGVSDGTFDIAFPYVPTPSRMKEFLYSRPVVWVGADTGLFVRKGHALEGVGFAGAALAGVPRLRLCRVRGYAEAEELQTPEAKGRFVAVDSTSDEECLRFLLRGRVDAFFYGESRLPALFEQARLAPLDLGRMDVRFRGTSYHFIVSRRLPDAPARLAQLDAAIEEVLEGKEADELVRRFTTHDVLATGPYSSR